MVFSASKAGAALKKCLPFISAILFLGAVWALHRELRETSFAELKATVHGMSWTALLLSLLAVGADYLLLTLGDWFAVREAGGSIPYRRVALVSFIGNAVGFNVGASLLSGGSVRYRLYSSLGMQPAQIARVVALSQIVFFFGISGISGVALLFAPGEVLASLGWPPLARYGVGALCLGVPIFLLALRIAVGKERELSVAGHAVPLPQASVLAKQYVVGFLDPILASFALYFLLPGGGVSAASFCAAFVVAALAGAASQVPGGLGVFDASLVMILSSHYPKAALLSALLVYRLLYYVVPLVAAVLLLVFVELRDRAARELGRLASLLPYALALWTFLAGAGLLLTTAVPLQGSRLALLRAVVSLPVLELSHFLKSILGTSLLFLSWGLARRMRSAWTMSVATLGMAAVATLASGLNVHLALFLLLTSAALAVSRRRFYRLSCFSTFSAPPAGWLAMAAVVIMVVVWFGFFSFRHVEYAGELWWKFAFSRSAPRFLRAMVGIGISVLAALFLMWLRPARSVGASPDERAMRGLVAVSADSDAALALLGDKRFAFSGDGSAAVMYAPSGDFWIAMGNPIGIREGACDAIWRFCEEADRVGAKPVFYEVDDTWLSVFHDVGLHIQPIGEEGVVDVSDMTEGMAGGKWKHIRSTCQHLRGEGCTFRLLEETERNAAMPLLRAISDEWLAHMHGREKGFSLGFFDEAYLANFPIAIVEREGKPMAFSNLWLGGTSEQFSVDLMRYSDSAPEGIMTLLFVETMLWGRAKGFRFFKLGMTPLSSMNPDNSLWERGAEFIYRHGGRFYNFQGLRMYKEKFHPEWRKKYLVYPNAVTLPLILPQLVRLISAPDRRDHPKTTTPMAQ